MKLRQALKIYNGVGTPAERPWKQSTIATALRRYEKTDSSRDANEFWDHLMRLRRQQLADEDFDCDADEWDDEECEYDEAVDECGLLPAHLGGGCQLAGTEYCDFECPFRDNPSLLTGEDDSQ